MKENCLWGRCKKKVKKTNNSAFSATHTYIKPTLVSFFFNFFFYVPFPYGQVQKCKTYANKLPCSYCTHICILHTCTHCIAHDSSLDRWTALNQENAFQLSSSQCPALNVGPWKRPSHVTKAELATGWESSLVNYHQTRKAATLRVHKSCDCLWLSALHVRS